MPAGAQVLAKALQRHGVTEIFGQSIPSKLFLAGAELGIRQLAYRTENAGAAMADAYARTSGRVSVVAAQNGPAATLLVAGLGEALKASIPVVAIVQDVPTTARERNAFQELDHITMFSAVSRWVKRVDEVNRLEDYVDMAFTAAASGHPGPAVLLVPVDVLDQTVTTRSERTACLGRYPLDRSVADPQAVAKAAECLAQAKRPIIIAGGGIHGSRAYEPLARLQAMGFPVATTVMGKGAVDETQPLSLGVVGYFMGPRSRSEGMRSLVTEADVVFLVGNRTNQNGTDSWQLYPRDAQVIHLDIDGQEIGRNYEALRLVGDAKLTLTALADAMASALPDGVHAFATTAKEKIQAGRAHWQSQMAQWVDMQATPVRPERLMAELDAQLDSNSRVVADASYSSIWVANFLTARHVGARFLTPRGLAGLGWGLPFAIGTKAADPDAVVHCVTGDGGFGHCWAELETAMRLKLPVIVTVLNNQLLGYQKHSEQVLHGAYTDACDFLPVDHAAIANACGAYGVRITDSEQYGEALASAILRPSVTVLDVITDASAYPPVTAYSGSSELEETFW
ncbi:acetolactate synthase catalytic subunit [Spiribacter sp. C176]|uniref:Acetolactate synthase catalytic subunit n=1 Tax=Spiribacter salilacus TaxID=2664894 RepID=A0A6N7QL61_9GAMM|nr:acetolactate synthase catalytic subunit [Spiribacter salilacus]MRH77161.1 acetolactate synthase catalytic subunit [Spiribacter salilacus]